MSPLTGAQRRIVDALDSSLCVTSGAGCGKTSVLVARYVRFLEQDLTLGLERLAAITFTENAAAEMRGRIREACRKQVAAAQEAGDPRRMRVWLQRYWDVDIASIDTIHAFCAALLRRYAIEAGVDPNFALLDEAEASFLREDVVRATVEQLLESDDADLLAVLAHHNIGPARDLLTDVLQEKREVLQRVAAPTMARSDDEILRDLKQAVDEGILRAARGVLEKAEVREAAATLSRESGKDGDKLEQVRRESVALLDRLRGARTAEIALAAVAGLLDGIDLRGGSAKAWPSANSLAAVKAALKRIRDTLDKATKNLTPFDETIDRQHLTLARAFYRTACRVIEAYEAAKRGRSALDFEDLQIRARDLLRKDGRVREECRKRFRAILVDELQDTNLLQFEIVDLLVSGEGTARRPPPLRPGALFGVGDPKQSIYRFRGAEFEVFQKALGRVGAEGRRDLSESFRLHPGMAALVNHLFAPLMGDLYEPIAGMREQKNDAVAELHYVAHPQDERFLSEEGHLAEANRLAARLREIVETRAVTVQDRETNQWRPARYGDIAILLRRMSDLHLYEQALEHARVPYYVVAGRGFFKQQEVLDVIHLLRVLDDPSDDLHLAGVLRSPFFAVSDEGLFHLRQMGRRLHDALAAAAEADHLAAEDRRGLRRAAEVLPQWAARKDHAGLATLIDQVVFESGYAAAAVGRFGGERAYANLRQMVELARRFEREGLHALGDYIDYVTDFMQSEMRAEQASIDEPGADSVRLMTIHKAKGLEFPVVVVPDLAYRPQESRQAYFIHPLTGVAVRMRDEDGESRTSSALALARRDAADADRAETHRLLYVAVTRARDYLLLVSHQAYNIVYSESWLDILLHGLAVDIKGDVEAVRLPTGHVVRVGAEPPLVEPAGRGERRVGPRDLFAAGCVAWDRLHERAQGAANRAADALSRIEAAVGSPRPPARITATALAAYSRCPALYRWSEVLGVREPGPPATPAEAGRAKRPAGLSPQAWGQVMHRAMELSASPEAADVAAAVEGAIREAPAAGQRDELRRPLAAGVRSFWAGPLGRRVAKARRALRELPFVLRLDGTEIRGTMDLVFEGADGTWEVVDYKSSVPARESAEQAAAEYKLQLGLYALAAGRWLGRPVDRWAVHFLESAETAEGEAGPAAEQQAEAAAREALAGIAAGRFDHDNRDMCRYCRFIGLCGGQSAETR